MYYLLTIACGIIYTEFVGYWIHILLHSERVPSLSRAHMEHHLRDYGPKKPLHRDGPYVNSAEDRPNVLGLGLEWFLPCLSVIGFTIGLLTLLGVPWNHQLVFTIVGIAWGHFLFGIMHSAMHYKVYWMMKVPGLRHWYERIRQLHDYHHLQFSDDGRMQKNYGICFFWFDRIFRTFSPQQKKFNHQGYTNALTRYSNVLGGSSPQ